MGPNNYDTKNLNPDSLYYYDGFAIIGYRINIDSPYVAYRYPYCTSHGWESYQEVVNIHKNDFEINLENEAEFIWSNNKNDWVAMKFKYNVRDILFWTHSVLWQKGTIIPGYYTFEVDRYAAGGETKHGEVRNDGINLDLRNVDNK